MLPKRLFDLVVGTVLAVLALPVIAVFAVGVAFSLRCWPFFMHRRVGLAGRPFACMKLRTLPRSFPRYAGKAAIDPHRMPRFVRFLREHHLDELPQLLLVPLGTMSLVGPRPEMRHLRDAGDAGFAEARTEVRPGCTGIWQIGHGASRMIWEAPEYDLFYLGQSSLRLDLWILWRSALLMGGLASTVGLDDVPAWALRRAPAPAPARRTPELVGPPALAAE